MTRTNTLQALVISGRVRGLSMRDIEAALAETLPPRRRCGLLGPVSDDIEQPEALLLAWLPALDIVRLGLDADERWRPGWLPALMRIVVRLVPAFRRWPTTYRWRAEVRLGDEPTLTAAWERVDPSRGRRSPATREE